MSVSIAGLGALVAVGGTTGAEPTAKAQGVKIARDRASRPTLLAEDLRRVQALQAALRATDLSAHEFLRAARLPSRSRDIGLGGRRAWGSRTAWYFDCSITIVEVLEEDRGRIAGLELEWRLRGASPYEREILLSEWNPPVEREQDGVRYSFERAALMGELRDRAAQALGALEPVSVPSGLEPAYRGLVEAWKAYAFGTGCSITGRPPFGRRAIETLVAAERWDLVRNALRGLNPEGRVYAAEALLEARNKGRALADADREVIRRIRGLPMGVETCEGCIFWTTSAADLLPDP